MDEDLSIHGTLEESSLPELLRSICKSRESGILAVTLEDFAKRIFVSDGQILFASSTNIDDRLGESLLRYGKITVRHFIDASKMVRPGKRLGSILCDMKAITPEELVDAVRVQVRDIIRSLFQRSSGEYELVLKQVDTQEMILLGMSTEDIVFDGIKSIQSWARISQGIGPYTGRLVPSADSDKVILNLTLTNEESDIFTLCHKGQSTIEEICGLSYLTNFDTCRILFGFLMVGALEAIEPVEEARAEALAAAAGPAPASHEAELDLNDLVEGYNELFAHIYDYAFERVAEQADELSRKAMDQVRMGSPEILYQLDLDSYGRLDFDGVLRNCSRVPEAQRMPMVASAMEEILYALLFETGAHFGPEHQKKLTLEVQKLRRR